jgi:bifunctional non-homologous end joining protein LigD
MSGTARSQTCRRGLDARRVPAYARQTPMEPSLSPMRLLRISEPFDHPQFLYEPKLDGFRALAHIQGDACALVSRTGHPFSAWPELAEEIAGSFKASV